MSTPNPDRICDIVEQDWNLREFKKNPIALWGHDTDNPIGVWENVRVEANNLLGKLRLAARGTSGFIDTLHSLIEQRIVKAVSVGFIPTKAEPLDEENPWGGWRLSGNNLLECSLCTVPMNAEALSLAKSLKGADMGKLFLRSMREPGERPAAEQLGLNTKGAANPTVSGSSDRRNLVIQRARSAVFAADIKLGR
jgi:HK97 family phage prohead protease